MKIRSERQLVNVKELLNKADDVLKGKKCNDNEFSLEVKALVAFILGGPIAYVLYKFWSKKKKEEFRQQKEMLLQEALRIQDALIRKLKEENDRLRELNKKKDNTIQGLAAIIKNLEKTIDVLKSDLAA